MIWRWIIFFSKFSTSRSQFAGQILNSDPASTSLASPSYSSHPNFLSEMQSDHLQFLRQWEQPLGRGFILCSTDLIDRIIATHHTMHLNRDSLHLTFSIISQASSVGSDMVAAAMFIASEVTGGSTPCWKSLCQKIGVLVDSAKSARGQLLAELNFQVD